MAIRRQLADLLAPSGEHVTHQVIGNDLAEDARHHRRHDLLFDGLRQVGVDVVEPARVEPVTDRNGQPHRQTLLGLHFQRFDFALGSRRAQC